MVIFGCLGAAIAILGFLTAYCRKCFCIGCFAFFSLVLWIVFLFSGIILIFIGNLSQQTVDEFCVGQVQNEKGQEYFGQTFNEIDLVMGEWASKLMCTDMCACNESMMNVKLWDE